MKAMTDQITRADVWQVPLALPHTLKLGSVTYSTRDYVVLRICTSDGFTGKAVGYTRHTPLFESLCRLLGDISTLPTDPGGASQRFRAEFAPGWGAMVRAASLIDIALWDVAAQRAGSTMRSFLGAGEGDPDIMVDAGYFMDSRGEGLVLDEIDRFIDDGYAIVKLMIKGSDGAEDAAFAERVSERMRGRARLAIDTHGALASLEEAPRYLRHFEGLPIEFLEDPFPSYESLAVTEFAGVSDVPVASGEDLVTPDTYRQLVEGGVRLLRVDATATGGYSAALEGTFAASAAGVSVLPHVWAHIHSALSGTSEAGLAALEVTPDYVGADPIDLMLTEPMPIVDGRWRAPEVPGLYLPLDFDEIARLADRAWCA